MANCGCVPCKTKLPKKNKKCNPFTLCVGNYTLIFDGNCPVIVPRKYQIPNGTYTSITFEEGCIVGVGEAPIPQYTPQQCCGEEYFEDDGNVSSELFSKNVAGNLAQIQNGSIVVKPVWDLTGNVIVDGSGVADKPYKPKIKISKKNNNTLIEETDGLFANLFFKTTGTVEVKGKGTKSDPYKLNVLGAEAKLPKINQTEILGNGFTLDEYGRWKVDDDFTVVTKLKVDHPAFNFVDQGGSVVLLVDDNILRTGANLVTGTGLSGKGNTNEPLKLKLDVNLVGEMLSVIEQDANLKQRLKSMLGV